MPDTRGRLFVMSGPSGVGKSTIVKDILENYDNLRFSVSSTTRGPREGEVDGVNYHFVSKEEFQKKIENKEFLEYAEYVGQYYGTTKAAVDMWLDQGKDVLLDIEIQGAMQVKKARPEAILIFIAPPSMEVLQERLVGRGTETAEKISRRLETAMRELDHCDNYDYVIVNHDVKSTVEKINEILTIRGN